MILEDLFEGASPVLYHYTNAHAAADIIRNNRFQLSIATGSDIESKYSLPGYDYFLSLTRTRMGDYHRYASNGAVMFVLDGTWFRGRYPVRPVDYWARMWNQPLSGRSRESEDRVFSREPEIPASAIVATHVLLTVQQEHRSYNVRQLLVACKQRGISAYLYTDEESWRLQDTRKSVPPNQVLELLRGQQPQGYSGRGFSYLRHWIELIHKKSRQDLSKDANRTLYNLKYYPGGDDNLAMNISNARKPGQGPDRKYAIDILSYMRQHNIPTLAAFRDAIVRKWNDIQEREKPIQENDAEHRSALQQTGFWGRQGAGCVFMALDTRRICLAHRSAAVEQPGTWGTWGGAIDSGEDPTRAVRREVAEEAGYQGPLRLIPLLVFSHSSGFRYYNFLALVPREFEPRLDWETQGSAWFDPGEWPDPLHPGMTALLRDPASARIIRHLQTRSKIKENLGSKLKRSDLDRVLVELCDLVISGQRQDPEHNGLVAACVIGPQGRVSRTSHREGSRWTHAERQAVDAYEKLHGPVDGDCIVVTTLSPCTNQMRDRQGSSCRDFLDSRGITQIYAGYKDPTQGGHYKTTTNTALGQMCKRLADTFLKSPKGRGK